MMAKLKQIGYTITYDQLVDEKITPKVAKLMGEMHEVAIQGSKNGDKLLEKTIATYPSIPQFKNYLSIWYNTKGNTKKAIEVNDSIIKKHPEYLFAKVNKAAMCIDNRDFDTVIKLLGSSLDLKALYPERTVFHVSEVEAMSNIAVQYYVYKGDFEQARIRLDILKEINPESVLIDAFENFILATEVLSKSTMETEDFMRTTINQPKTRKKLAPKFNHKEIELLYKKEILSEEDIQMLLALPRVTLINDLETVLEDSIARYTYFSKEEFDSSNYNFVFNSLLLLRELKATESLPKLLHVLAQSEEYLYMYFADLLPEYLWMIIYELGQNQIEVLLDYVKKPLIYTYSKTSVTSAISQLALFQPKRRREVIKCLKDVMNYYIKGKEEEIDPDFIGLLIGDVVDIQAKELLPEIEKLFELEYVDYMACGDLEEIMMFLTGDLDEVLQLEIKTIGQINMMLEGNEDLDDDMDSFSNEMYNDFILNQFTNHQIINSQKVNRNDPCPCGSGKKYKKCCLLKNTNA
ncbi:DUF1186 domain-containing protein [Myroides odoratimimus]|nr:DUF1186 domain-containing protein [Myroides odoratimimus]